MKLSRSSRSKNLSLSIRWVDALLGSAHDGHGRFSSYPLKSNEVGSLDLRPHAAHSNEVTVASRLTRNAIPHGEIQNKLAAIKNNIPSRFPQDGNTFRNTDRALPDKPFGYYKEYVIATPGQSGAGRRRIVCGDGGEVYYTADHYRTFEQVK
ncbi:ribonuclease domain-containing protein [Aerophototrophica crusticola]